MSRYGELTVEIDESPEGPHIGAFFDVDRTLISEFSAEAFFRDLVRASHIGRGDMLRSIINAVGFNLGRVDFRSLFKLSAQVLAGTPQADLEALGDRLFDRRLASKVFPEARAIIDAHRRRGHRIVLESSATRYQVGAIARALDADNLLCNDYEVKDGVLTGEIVEPIVFGDGKVAAARELAERDGIDLSESWFYSDGGEDVPMMEAVGHPRPTNPDKRLTAAARSHGWPELRFSSRGRPGPLDAARTLGVVGAFVGSIGLSVPLGLLNGDKRAGLNTGIGIFGDLATSLAGITLHVEGEEHLWSHRPAVFIFNHQSQSDVVIMAKLLRRDITGVAKKELKSNPIVGPAFSYAGIVFIDRADREKAIHQLEPVVDTIRSGTSLLIAPEGTRSTTPEVGRFKKGAFVIAMQAGVPIVPVALRNPMDVLPKGSMVIRPAPVDVMVHEPIPTDDWTHDDLDERIAQIRDWYLEVMV